MFLFVFPIWRLLIGNKMLGLFQNVVRVVLREYRIQLQTFILQFNTPMKEWSKKDWRDILTSTLRVIFWAIFIEVVLHYFYFNSIMLHLRLMWHIPLWALAGIGYGAGQFFMVKVYVYYQCITPHGTTVFSLHPISIPQAILRFGLRHTQNLLG